MSSFTGPCGVFFFFGCRDFLLPSSLSLPPHTHHPLVSWFLFTRTFTLPESDSTSFSATFDFYLLCHYCHKLHISLLFSNLIPFQATISQGPHTLLFHSFTSPLIINAFFHLLTAHWLILHLCLSVSLFLLPPLLSFSIPTSPGES